MTKIQFAIILAATIVYVFTQKIHRLTSFNYEDFKEIKKGVSKSHEDFCAKNPCGENSECHGRALAHFCRCKCGYSGNSYVRCNPNPIENIRRIEIGISLDGLSFPDWLINISILNVFSDYVDQMRLAALYRNNTIMVPDSAYVSRLTYAMQLKN